jgi:hypothetical protein
MLLSRLPKTTIPPATAAEPGMPCMKWVASTPVANFHASFPVFAFSA